METRKIAAACFIAGALFCTAALLLAPRYWWLGLLAGLAGGYVSYEFREFLAAVPVAWRQAQGKGSSAWRKTIAWVKGWLAQPHPFAYAALIFSLPLSLWIGRCLWLEATSWVESFWLVMAFPVLLADVYVVVAMILYILAFIGARTGERCFWLPFFTKYSQEIVDRETRSLEEQGYRRKDLTYGNVLHWAALGLGLVLLAPAKLTARFLRRLFWLIRSRERVVCAIDGTLGGLISYWWLGPGATSLMEKIVLVICGGLLGAAFGVFDYEVFSRRLLRVPRKF